MRHGVLIRRRLLLMKPTSNNRRLFLFLVVLHNQERSPLFFDEGKIYLIHMFIFYYGLAITHLDGSSLLWRTLGPVIAYIICLVVVLIGKKIPVIRRLFP